MSPGALVYLVVLACVCGAVALWLRHRSRDLTRQRESWALLHGWTYVGEADDFTEDLHFAPFTRAPKGRNVWVVTGIHHHIRFSSGVFEYNARRADAPALFQHPWVWVDCPIEWQRNVVTIPSDPADTRWHPAFDDGSAAHVSPLLVRALSSAPGFTFFIGSGRLGLVAAHYLDDESAPLHQAINRFVERIGGSSVDKRHSYSDYEQMMEEKLTLLIHIRSLIVSASQS